MGWHSKQALECAYVLRQEEQNKFKNWRETTVAKVESVSEGTRAKT